MLKESLSKQSSSPIESDETGEKHTTKLTMYARDSKFQHPSKYHKDYSGVTHSVAWKNIKPKEEMTQIERKRALHDAMHLHNHFIKHNTEVGDVVSNEPLPDEDSTDKNSNKRARIYTKTAGFGGTLGNTQYGIVRQHPDDHEDEHKRGQKYLHPLEHDEIKLHGNKPSAGASDNKVRHLKKKYEDGISINTQYNGIHHNSFVPNTGLITHDISKKDSQNQEHHQDSTQHHKKHVNDYIDNKT